MYLATTGATAAAHDVSRGRVAGPVLALGAVSLVTDISSEMVTAVLPLYFVLHLGLSPLQFGFLDGLYNGVTALVRLAGGHAADRGNRHKLVAGSGYALSALSRLGLLLAGGGTLGIGAALAADRLGKGVRTAPRDALISLSSPPEALGRAFGVHRAMDTTGAFLGPLAAFALMWVTADAYDAVFVVSFCVGLLGVLMFVAFVPGRDALPLPTLTPTPMWAPTPAPAPKAAGVPGRTRTSAAAAAKSPASSGTHGTHGTHGTSGTPGTSGTQTGLRPRLLDPFRDPAFRRILGAASMLGASTIGDAFIYLLLQRQLDFAVRWFPLLPLGAAAVYLLLAVPAGRLGDRIGRRVPFLCGHAALLGAYLLLFTTRDGPTLLVGVLLLVGVFYAATDGVLMALAGPVLPAARRASGMALLQMGQALCRLLAAAGFGAAWTLWGVRPALLTAVLALGLALACSAVLLRRLEREA
ncbi:MFS transporter [Streptomyces sp. H27-D2]|uniref:MFS transporter n=1 Tax=Streptomyces sp. H27-D2 TaxID=3046304 RepID=UPI002DBA417F|nr:MFS transporter [Streptomyces sp. H27-D2]MEC4015455.1 MFS transporter [Streptomyces sp. H27-D2]